MADLYIGLISGTSVDGIDAALVEFGDAAMTLHGALTHPWPGDLRERLGRMIVSPGAATIDELCVLDRRVGAVFGEAALALLDDSGVDAGAVAAIGSHGQTVRHLPDAEPPFTLQIGDPATIASATGIVTVADFRRADVAEGGQGAPLMPAFHQWLFRAPGRTRVVLNLGGIGNVTVLPADGAVSGFDTGPGNTLLDAWIRRHEGRPFDAGGRLAAAGSVDEVLLGRLLSDPYFAKPAPKSTGFEYFNLAWLDARIDGRPSVADVQATLTELTARSVADAIRRVAPETADVLVCGGGAHNPELSGRLAANLPGVAISTTQSAGLDPDWVEASGFAWLAKQALDGQPGNLPSVTGARRAVVLGAIHQARRPGS